MLRTYKDDHEFYASLPRKRVGACGLVFYKQQLLIVQPTYHSGWILPGGTVEAEESPLEGLKREIKEELSISIEATGLLSVDYISNRDVRGEYIQFLFACKEISEHQAQSICLQAYELNDHRFVDIPEALGLLSPLVARRVENTLAAQATGPRVTYLENGSPWL